MQKHSLAGLFAGLAAASIWGGMYVVSKVVLEVIPPFALLATRLVLGIAALGAVIVDAAKSKIDRATNPADPPCRLCGLRDLAGIPIRGDKTLDRIQRRAGHIRHACLCTSVRPIPARRKNHQRTIVRARDLDTGGRRGDRPAQCGISPSLFWGNLSLLAAALTWALYSVLVRKVSQTGDLLTTSAVMLAGGIPSSLLFGFWETQSQGIGEITLGVIGGILFLGIISTAIAMFLWNYAFAELPAAVASLTFFAQPVVGTILGTLFLGEEITHLFLFGGLLIGIGLVIASTEK